MADVPELPAAPQRLRQVLLSAGCTETVLEYPPDTFGSFVVMWSGCGLSVGLVRDRSQWFCDVGPDGGQASDRWSVNVVAQLMDGHDRVLRDSLDENRGVWAGDAEIDWLVDHLGAAIELFDPVHLEDTKRRLADLLRRRNRQRWAGPG